MRATKEMNKNQMCVGARLRPCPNNRGITLIALVITIIVMLILVGVTISMAVNGGLFDYAGKAVGDTNNAIQVEGQLGNGGVTIDGTYYNSIDEYLVASGNKGNAGGSGEPGGNEGEGIEIPEGIKVGDYVNYTPTEGTYKVADGTNGSGYTTTDGYQTFTTETGESALKWRVLSIDEEKGEVELVAATAAQTSTKLYLQGADGYNHAVDILNDLCKELYSNTSGAEARSIKVEDINAKTTYDYTEYTNTSTGFTYGDTKQLSTYGTSYMNYPNLYSQEKGYGTAGTMNTSGLNGSEGKEDGETDSTSVVTTYSTVTGSTNGNTAGTDPYITYTYYYYKAEDYLNTNLGVNTAPAGLINVGTTYWLASRCVNANSNYAYFFVRYLSSSGDVNRSSLFNSSGNTNGYSYAVRPVVSLGSNVTLTKDTTNSTEDTTYWNIAYKN